MDCYATPFQKQPEVLIVDDVPENLQMLTGMLLTKGYKVRPVLSGRLAIKTAQSNPPDLILLDITMPDMNGYQVCAELKSNPLLQSIPVIFISALAETGDKVKAFEAGGVDYITKPFKIQEVQARVDTHLRLHLLHLELERTNAHLHDMVREQVRELSDSQMATIFALAKLAESRDDETSKHLERVSHNCKLLASWLRENSPYSSQISTQFINDIFWTSPLHDIGKVGVPDAILLKPGKLSEEEFEVVKKHTIIGAETLEAVRSLYPRNSFVSMGVDIAKQHHEKWDGSGYPHGISGDAIALSARIMAVADVYDALRTKRVYKPAFSQEKTYGIITEGSGSHFDPLIIDAFKNLHEKFDELRAGYLDPMHDNID